MYLRTIRRKNKEGSEVVYYRLAETVYNSAAKRLEARIIHNFGRADEVDIDGLRRLASSILRLCDEPDLGDGTLTPPFHSITPTTA